MPQLQLTVDVGVLMSGSRLGDLQHADTSQGLMKCMIGSREHLLTLDSRNKIMYQYGLKLKQGTFGHHWLRQMAARGKTCIINWQKLDRGTITQLKEAHFDTAVGEDFKYVVTAAGSIDKILVSHDPDYSIKVRRILRKRLDILVHNAASAQNL